MSRAGRAAILLAGAAATICACATGVPGEQASYALWNADRVRTVWEARVEVATTGRLVTAVRRQGPWLDGSPGWSGWGVLYFNDNRLRIPQYVDVSWWFDPVAAGRRDPRARQGPFRIALRARISAHALAAAASGERRYQLEIGIGAGVVPPMVRWQLLDRSRPPDLRIVESGGDRAPGVEGWHRRMPAVVPEERRVD